jgi:hypothetical protein
MGRLLDLSDLQDEAMMIDSRTTDDRRETERFRFVLRSFMPSILRKMLHQGLIDVDKSSDPNYLWNIVHENKNVARDIRVITQIHDGFLEVAEYAKTVNKPEVVIVLLATTIEHLLNLYFSEKLTIQKLAPDEISQFIRKNSIDAKIGWLISITGRLEFPEGLKKRVMNLVELRNSIVHYKAIPAQLDEEDNYQRIKDRVKEIDFDELFATVTDLDNLLESALDKADPNRQLAREMARIMFED